jgi:hypothetical protein
MTKRIVLDDNDLFRKLHPILLDIFSRGVLAGQSKKLMLAAFLSIVTSPFAWAVLVFKKAIHLAILFAVYWFLREEIAHLGALGNVLIAVAIVAIFYKELYNELVQLILYILVIVTGGGFLRWICRGYLAGNGFRQQWLTLRPMEGVVGTMVAAISKEYRDQYDKLMDLYLESNQSGNEDDLNHLMEEYEQGSF